MQDRIMLVLFTNRKSHTGCRLVLTSVTLNDLEQCNDGQHANDAISAASEFLVLTWPCTECEDPGMKATVPIRLDRSLLYCV